MAVIGVAPCQCFSPGENQTTSPGRISSTGPPSRWAQPQPEVTSRVCPSGCVCHAVRAQTLLVTSGCGWAQRSPKSQAEFARADAYATRCERPANSACDFG